MNAKSNRPVIIREDDYELLKPYISRSRNAIPEMSLAAELGRAKVVKKDAFPKNVVRINSRILIRDEENATAREFTIVMPQHADIKQNKISIISPIASALIGFSEGEVIDWQVPLGLKRFKIIKVSNETSL